MKFKQNIITIIIKKEGWKCNRHVTVKASNSIKECTYSYVGRISLEGILAKDLFLGPTIIGRFARCGLHPYVQYSKHIFFSF